MKLPKRPSDWEGWYELTLSTLSVLAVPAFFIALWYSANTITPFETQCLADGGEFTKGYILILPIQTCTYPKSTKP